MVRSPLGNPAAFRSSGVVGVCWFVPGGGPWGGPGGASVGVRCPVAEDPPRQSPRAACTRFPDPERTRLGVSGASDHQGPEVLLPQPAKAQQLHRSPRGGAASLPSTGAGSGTESVLATAPGALPQPRRGDRGGAGLSSAESPVSPGLRVQNRPGSRRWRKALGRIADTLGPSCPAASGCAGNGQRASHFSFRACVCECGGVGECVRVGEWVSVCVRCSRLRGCVHLQGEQFLQGLRR